MAPSRAITGAVLAALVTLATATAEPKQQKQSGDSLLQCRCDPRYCDSPTCLTDGVCFASLKRSSAGGPVDASYRCFDADYLIPPGRPFFCEYNRRQNHTYVSGCCRGQDLCNERMELALDPRWPEDGGAGVRRPFGGRKRGPARGGVTDEPGQDDDDDSWTWERILVVVVLGAGSAVSVLLLMSVVLRRMGHRLHKPHHHHHRGEEPRSHQAQQQGHRRHRRASSSSSCAAADCCCGLFSASYNEVNSCGTSAFSAGASAEPPHLTAPLTAGAESGSGGGPSAAHTHTTVRQGPGSSSGYGSGTGSAAPTSAAVLGRGAGRVRGPPSSSSGENMSSSLQVSCRRRKFGLMLMIIGPINGCMFNFAGIPERPLLWVWVWPAAAGAKKCGQANFTCQGKAYRLLTSVRLGKTGSTYSLFPGDWPG